MVFWNNFCNDLQLYIGIDCIHYNIFVHHFTRIQTNQIQNSRNFRWLGWNWTLGILQSGSIKKQHKKTGLLAAGFCIAGFCIGQNGAMSNVFCFTNIGKTFLCYKSVKMSQLELHQFYHNDSNLEFLLKQRFSKKKHKKYI